MSRIRIIIADDHAVVRRGLRQFFVEERDFEVIGEYEDGVSAIDGIRRLQPDVAVLDLRMPSPDGIEIARRLFEEDVPTPIVLLVGNISDDEVIEAMRVGVKGVVLKEMAPSLLVQSIRKVAAGGTWIEKDSMTRVLERLIRREDGAADPSRARSLLTAREIEVVQMVATGLSNREIGEKLFISEATVKTHLHAIFEKLEVKSRVQLVSHARELRLVD